MKYAILLCLVGIAAAVRFDSTLDSSWNLWKAQFNRAFSESEEVFRRAIWENTAEFIARHNLEADMGLHTYTLGLNQFSDWTDNEYQQLLGWKSLEELNMTDAAVDVYYPPANEVLPNAIDWRQRGAVQRVKNQGSCGSCWAFGSMGCLEGQTFLKYGRLPDLSEQQCVDCSRAFGNKGCNGGNEIPTFNYVASITRVGSAVNIQSCYPYTGRDGTCHVNPAATCKGATCAGGVQVTRGDAGLTSAINSIGPISVAIDAGRPTFRSYKTGIYNDPGCSKTRLNHAVLAVGWNTGYYIVKNSWGTSWGQAGYINMAKDVNCCGIATDASYPRL